MFSCDATCATKHFSFTCEFMSQTFNLHSKLKFSNLFVIGEHIKRVRKAATKLMITCIIISMVCTVDAFTSHIGMISFSSTLKHLILTILVISFDVKSNGVFYLCVERISVAMKSFR